jgi:hypothetical protein
MIDRFSKKKVKTMEVYVSIEVDVSKIATYKEASELAGLMAQQMMDDIEPKFTVTDWYEVYRDKETGELQDPVDEITKEE